MTNTINIAERMKAVEVLISEGHKHLKNRAFKTAQFHSNEAEKRINAIRLLLGDEYFGRCAMYEVTQLNFAISVAAAPYLEKKFAEKI